MNGVDESQYHSNDVERIIADSKIKDGRIEQLDYMIKMLRDKLESLTRKKMDRLKQWDSVV